MSDIEVLKEALAKLEEALYGRVPRDDYDRFKQAHADLKDAAEKAERATLLQDEETVRRDYSRYLNFRRIIDDLKSRQGPSSMPPSYLYDVAPSLCTPPYTIPQNLSESEGAQRISIAVGGRLFSERAELALALLFPGSTTYRYGRPVKVRTGPWFQSGRARLASIHELHTPPEFEVEVNQKKYRVFRPVTLHSTNLRGQEFLCSSCLSISDGDEDCNHASPEKVKLPSGHPIVWKAELSRKEGEKKTLGPLLNRIVDSVSFLEVLEVGIALRGFERTASLRAGQRTIRVEFEPLIGFRMVTSGISFRISSLTDTLESLMQEAVFRRDMVIQLLSRRIEEVLRRAELPSYHHELLLSAAVRVLGLDSVVSLESVNRDLAGDRFVPNAVQETIRQQRLFYQSPLIDPLKLAQVFEGVAIGKCSLEELARMAQEVVMHSLAHAILLACAVTSGSQLDDLDYIVGSNEVVILDAESGGNGSSEMCFQFLSEPGEFNLEEYMGSEGGVELYRPRNFDETVLELLLPCLNGVSDRAHFFGIVVPPEAEIRRKVVELRDKERTNPQAANRLRQYGLQSVYPVSIGYHAVDYSILPQDADRFKEMASLCIHGCPECISLGRKCRDGSFRERYSISKYAIDRLLEGAIGPYATEGNDSEGLRRLLAHHGLAILRLQVNPSEDVAEAAARSMQVVLGLAGQRIGTKHVKFSGHWVNFDSNLAELVYYYLLTVV